MDGSGDDWCVGLVLGLECGSSVCPTYLPLTPTLQPHTGFPHLGGERQLKRLLESFWGGALSEEDVRSGCVALPALCEWRDGRIHASLCPRGGGRGGLSAHHLTQPPTPCRARHLEAEIWGVQARAGVDFIGVGDFALYGPSLNACKRVGRLTVRSCLFCA